MPELPEVETVRRGLKDLIVGKEITAVSHDTAKSFPNDKSLVESFLLKAQFKLVHYYKTKLQDRLNKAPPTRIQ